MCFSGCPNEYPSGNCKGKKLGVYPCDVSEEEMRDLKEEYDKVKWDRYQDEGR